MPDDRGPGPDATPEILVVDDEKDIRDSIRSLLEAETGPVTVHTASTGQEALALLERHKVRLVLCDYHMPGMDGVQLLQQARLVRPGVAGVVVTSSADQRLAAEAVQRSGPGMLVATPLDLDHLVTVVRSILAGDMPPGGPPP